MSHEAPHRIGFASAAVVLTAAAVWWWAVLIVRAAGLDLPWALSPGLAHGLLFGFGFMPMFIVGFDFTAGPKWLRVAGPATSRLRAAVAGQLAGWLVFGVGVHAHVLLAAAALACVAVAWLECVRLLAAMLRASAVPDRLHLRLIAAAGALGGAAQLAAAAALAAGSELGARAALQLGLWGFVAPVFVVALHRMLPVFDDDVAPRLAACQPRWLLGTLVALCLMQAAFACIEILSPELPAAWHALPSAVDGAAALLVIGLVLRWWRLQGGLRLKLIAMLQAAVLWLGLAWTLAAVSHGLMAASGGTRSLGLAAQHAFAAGFLASAMMAMVTRVASGLAGRTVAADAAGWGLFLLLQLAAVLRVGASLGGEPGVVWVAAAGCFAVAVGLWSRRLWNWTTRAQK